MANIIWDGDDSALYTNNDNWQGSADPAAADDAFFPSGNSNPVAGTDQGGTALASFTTEPGYTGAIGSITDGKPTYLDIAATTMNLAGTGLTYLTSGACTTCNIRGAAVGAGTGQYGLNIITDDTVATMYVHLASGQSLGICTMPGEAAIITTLVISGSGTVSIGSGLTCTVLHVNGCDVTCESAVATVHVHGGTLAMRAAISSILEITAGTMYQEEGAIANAQVSGGTLYYSSDATLATADIFQTGTIDFDLDPRPVTVTTMKLHRGGTILDDHETVTWSHGIAPQAGMTITAQ